MTKSFVLYNLIEVGDDLVDCIYFLKGDCLAQPVARPREYYKPTEEEQNKYCKYVNSKPAYPSIPSDFTSCPRFTAYQSHLKATGLVK